jgi:lipopolysaccharide export system protein LptA
MASLKRIWTLALACGGLLVCTQAAAQLAPGTGDKGPIDVSGEKVERFDDKRLTVWYGGPSGPVEVDQAGARLVCDKLSVYSYGPGEGPNAQPQPAGAKPAAASAEDETTTGSIKQMIAEGHVYYVTQNETARGEHGVYDAEPDTITMTGNVVVVQGKNVLRGDKMVIDRKSGQTTMISDTGGRNNPNRVRAVIYNDNPGAQGQGAQPAQGKNAAKAPAAPAKKP